MSRLLLAVVALVGVGAGAWWLSVEPSADSTSVARPKSTSAPDEPADAPKLAPFAAEPTRTGSTTERSAAAPPAPPPEPQGLEDGGAAGQVGRDFSWKYQDIAEADLGQRLSALESQLQQALDVEMLPRFADGRFVEHRIERGETRSIAEVLAQFGGDDPWCRVWPVFDPAGAGSPTAQQQLIAVRVVCLTRSEHQALADLMDERAWLRSRVIPRGR